MQTQTNQERLDSRIAQCSKGLIPDFGKGKYSADKEKQFCRVIKIFGFTPAMAEKHAEKWASEIGLKMANSTSTSRTKSANKDDVGKFEEKSEAKGKMSPALTVELACSWAEKAGSYGISLGFTDWQLSQTNDALRDYVAWLQDVKVESVEAVENLVEA